MKAKITRPDGTLIEVEGNVAEIRALLAPDVGQQPHFVPTIWPARELPYAPPYDTFKVTCGCAEKTKMTPDGAILVEYPAK